MPPNDGDAYVEGTILPIGDGDDANGPQPPTVVQITALNDPQPARKQFTTTQKQSIARMLVAGVSPHLIAGAFGVSVGRINRLDREDPEIARFKDEQAGMITRQLVTTKFTLFEHLDEVTRILVNDGLRAQDARTKLETAKWVYDRTVPLPDKKVETQPIQLQLPEQLLDAITHLAANDASLRDTHARLVPIGQRVRTRLAELPSVADDPTPVETDGSPAA